MEQPEKPEGKNRTGFTTGTSATAASIACILSIINQKKIETVDVLQAGVEDDGHDSTAHHSIQQDRIIELTAQVSEKSTVISRLSQQNEELNSELIQLQKTEKNNSSKNNNMIATISSLERSLAKERSEVDSLQKELDSAVKRTQMQTLDLKEQKLTLPLIYALNNSSKQKIDRY